MLKQLTFLAFMLIGLSLGINAQVVTSGGGGKEISNDVKAKVQSLLVVADEKLGRPNKTGQIKTMQDLQMALGTLDLQDLAPHDSEHGQCMSRSSAALRSIFSDKELRLLDGLLKSSDFNRYLMTDEKLKDHEAQNLSKFFREKLKDIGRHHEQHTPKGMKPE